MQQFPYSTIPLFTYINAHSIPSHLGIHFEGFREGLGYTPFPAAEHEGGIAEAPTPTTKGQDIGYVPLGSIPPAEHLGGTATPGITQGQDIGYVPLGNIPPAEHIGGTETPITSRASLDVGYKPLGNIPPAEHVGGDATPPQSQEGVGYQPLGNVPQAEHVGGEATPVANPEKPQADVGYVPLGTVPPAEHIGGKATPISTMDPDAFSSYSFSSGIGYIPMGNIPPAEHVVPEAPTVPPATTPETPVQEAPPAETTANFLVMTEEATETKNDSFIAAEMPLMDPLEEAKRQQAYYRELINDARRRASPSPASSSAAATVVSDATPLAEETEDAADAVPEPQRPEHAPPRALLERGHLPQTRKQSGTAISMSAGLDDYHLRTLPFFAQWIDERS